MFGPTPPGPPQNPASQPLPMTGILKKLASFYDQYVSEYFDKYFMKEKTEADIITVDEEWNFQIFD